MSEDTTQKNTPQEAPKTAAPSRRLQSSSRGPASRGRQGGGGEGLRKNTRRPRRDTRRRSEYEQEILDIRRVTRVVAGGRRFSFSVALVAGDKKGTVGVGIGKAGDTALAIEKALRDAKKRMIKVKTTKDMSIPHEVGAKYASAVVRIAPAPGRGLIAGSAVRNVLDLAGVKNVSAKIYSRSKNHINNARAAVKALMMLRPEK